MDDAQAEETVARLRELLARGATIRQAAAELKRPRMVLFRLAKRHGLPLTGRRRLSEEQIASARAYLAEARLTFAQIAEKVGCSKYTVWKLVPKEERTGPRRVAEYTCSGCRFRVCLEPCAVCAARAFRGDE